MFLAGHQNKVCPRESKFWNIPLPEIQMATFAIGKMLAFAADAFGRV
jgi:hypothetical protein